MVFKLKDIKNKDMLNQYFKFKEKYDYKFSQSELELFLEEVSKKILSINENIPFQTVFIPETGNKNLIKLAKLLTKNVIIVNKKSKNEIIQKLNQQKFQKKEKESLMDSLEKMSTIKMADIKGNQRKRFIDILFNDIEEDMSFENTLLLWLAAKENEYKDSRFVTAKQAFDAGMSMEKGTKGHQIVQRFGMPMFPLFKKDDNGEIIKDPKTNKPIPERDEDGKVKYIYQRVSKLVTVFNVEQLKGDIPKRWNKSNVKLELENEELLGVEILKEALVAPLKQIAENAFIDPSKQSQNSKSSVNKSTSEKDYKPTEEIININTAQKKVLIKLPNVGKVTAERIIKYRDDFGPFKTGTDLLKIKGIGKKTLEKILPNIIF